ncbi:NINE protein [Cryptosporangium arvum]|uniref:NINE protein n=1 Tax=Cryptosporangium arvum TaxID=80871 RepID=UPI0004BACA4C|nr:NINE protein [Cryptosporangium arvum]
MTLPLPGPADRSNHDPWYPTDPASAPPSSGQQYGIQPPPSGVPYSGTPYTGGAPYAGAPYADPTHPEPYSAQPYSAQPYSAQPAYGMQPYGQQPAYPVPHPPTYTGAAFGIDPRSGRPFSDKSKLAAGLLQLLPGFFLGLGGIGRLYAGHSVMGTVQLVTTVLGWGSFWLAICGSFLVLPLLFFVVYAAGWLWFVIDGIMLLAGSPTDGDGRPLRA